MKHFEHCIDLINLDCTVHVDFLYNVVKIRTVTLSSCLAGRDYHEGNLSNTFAYNICCNITLNSAEHCNKMKKYFILVFTLLNAFVLCVVSWLSSSFFP